MTPYHAIEKSLPKLVPGSVAVVIGAGGLGHVAIQMLRALASCTVVAVDTSEEKLELARAVGAHHAVTSDQRAEEQILGLTGGRKIDVVFDFVGIDPTTDLASRLVGVGGDIVIVGVGPGTVEVGFFSTPWEASARAPYWGSRSELVEVVELARAGRISVEVEAFSLDEGPKAYERLKEGTVRGRAVIVP